MYVLLGGVELGVLTKPGPEGGRLMMADVGRRWKCRQHISADSLSKQYHAVFRTGN